MQGEMSVMGVGGDTKIIWDSGNVDEVSNAREQFNRLLAKGFIPFSVGKKGDQDKRITVFDPDAEKLIMVPPMAGG